MPKKTDPRSRIHLPADELSAMVVALDDRALAIAMRLISAQVESNDRGIPDDDATRRRMGVRRQDHWDRIRDQLMMFFDVTAGTWRHPAITDLFRRAARRSQNHREAQIACQEAATGQPEGTSSTPVTPPRNDSAGSRTRAQPAPVGAATASPSPSKDKVANQHQAPQSQTPAPRPPVPRVPRQGQGDLLASLPHQANPSPSTLPATGPARPASPSSAYVGDAPSLAKLAIDRGIALLMRAGMSEPQARKNMGMLCRDYDTGFVLQAIDQTERYNAADPNAYIRGVLKKYPRKTDDPSTGQTPRKPGTANTAAQPPKPFRPIADQSSLGISDGLASSIRRRNKQLGASFDFVDPAASTSKENAE
ncbi:hypothetical protein CKO28_02670 [Rhodovibrio sodomensis]|uniref:DUF1376 domain-containing protein n=1 Tax=Rhodovibrio sodomensis TaxID=1088 RepID=A0ABS1D962_9PROT|nr:hypothetical protein [Rhodovibrio sodomensis]MBK1666946.1 hypothetical protein [Rhodovibrio sodomensis]